MTPWVMRLIIINIGMFILAREAPAIQDSFRFIPLFVLIRPWTLLTYMFLHANFTHILFNMLGLFFFGPRLEDHLGGRQFLWLYFVSGVMGGLLSIPFNPYTAIIGASGAVYGVMLGFARFWPRENVYIWGILPIQARWMVIGMTVMTLWSGLGGGGDGIAHFAHLGGFLGGYLYLKWIEFRSMARRARFDATAPPPSNKDLEQWENIRRDNLHPLNRAELERILEKIHTLGITSLSADERAFLDRLTPD